jgi:NADPH2:quinone reductase
MRAVVCHEYGPPSSLVVADVPTPSPAAGQVRVAVTAAAVNFPDVLILANRYQLSVPPPFTPGSEFSGIVDAVGEGVTEWKMGDRVFGAGMVGAFAEQVITSSATLRRAPDGVDLAAMAGFWVASATAYHALRSVAEVQPGDKVLVLGAAGGVGLAAVELAAVLGAEVIAAASSPAKLAACCERGATHTIDYVGSDLRAGLREVAADGVDIVIDPVGGPFAEQALRSTRWGGRFVTVGFASGEIPRIPLNLVLLKGVIIKGFEIRTFGIHAPEEALRDEQELLALVADGRLTPHVSSVYSLDRAADALVEVAERRAIGKVLITP